MRPNLLQFVGVEEVASAHQGSRTHARASPPILRSGELGKETSTHPLRIGEAPGLRP